MSNTRPVTQNAVLTVVSKTATSITLKWNKATDKETPADKLSYTVAWCGPELKLHEINVGNTDSYTIKGLQPLEKYIVFVWVKDQQAAARLYDAITVTTLTKELINEVPTIPNKTVGIRSIGPTSITISWQSATDKETAQKDLKYLVQWTPGPDYASSNIKQSSYLFGNSYIITGLYPSRSYMVRVYVYDGKNYAVYNPLYVTTSASNPVDNSKAIRDLLASVPYSQTALINNNLYNDKTLYPDAIESQPDRDAAFLLTKKENTITNKEIYVRGSGYPCHYYGDTHRYGYLCPTGGGCFYSEYCLCRSLQQRELPCIYPHWEITCAINVA